MHRLVGSHQYEAAHNCPGDQDAVERVPVDAGQPGEMQHKLLIDVQMLDAVSGSRRWNERLRPDGQR